MNDTKWDLNDIVIIPAEESNISSRSECDVTCDFGIYKCLPLIASPMDTVVSLDNYEKYIEAGIIPCIPRGNIDKHPIDKSRYFMSYGLNEIESQLQTLRNITLYGESVKDPFYSYPNVLIDMANAHMSKLIDIIKEIKEVCPSINLMVGNVANPETFVNLGLAGVDMIRISIGNGCGCTTAANVSIHYPIGSLLSECAILKVQYGLKTKIVADGGMKNYSDVIKSLGIGADFVMIGSIFNKSIESAGFNYLYKIRINSILAEKLWKLGFPVKKKYRGMSTKAVQRSWGKTKLVTAEGITKYQRVEYTLGQWTENFRDYLKSAMSYTNSRTLEDFIGKVKYVHISEAARKRFDK
jgi:GMP reductase